MPSTPTTEGSIVAYLRADNGDLNRGIAEARAEVQSLTGTDTTVHVKADIASAVAKLDAVEAAQRRVAAAQIKYAAAADLATSASDRQWRVNQRLSASADAKARATDALTRAVAKADLASLELTASEDALARAQLKVAETAAAEAAAQDGAAAATGNASNANKTNITRMGLIVAAVAVLVPMIAPLSGYIVGVSGALAGMGAAGVLAILGIKNAMADGTVMGAQYSQGLQILRSDLTQLEQTSAGAMLTAFNGAVKILDEAMPQLNGEVGQFSRMLGTVGNSVLQGVINAFRILNPLFVASGQYVEGLAAGFQSWTTNGGLQKFANYAMSTLPAVEQTLGSLASAVMHILTALAPLGTFGLGVITVISSAINLLPTPTLTELAVAAVAVFGAFKLWPSLPGTIGNVTKALLGMSSAQTALTASSVGVVGGIGAMSLALAYFLGHAVDTVRVTLGLQQSADSLYTSLNNLDLKGLQQNTHDTVAGIHTDVSLLGQTLNSGWAFGFLKTVGDIQHGVLQFQPIVKLMGGSANDLSGHMSDLDTAMAKLVTSGHTKQAQAAYKALAVQTDGSKDALKNLTGYLPNYEAAMKQANAATGGATTAAQQATTYLGITSSTYQALASQVDAATTASKNWKAEQDLVNGIAQSVEQANITMALSFTTMATTIAANIKSSGAAAATSMDINTQYGAQNHQMILTQVQDAEAVAFAKVAADKKAGLSRAAAAADGNAILATQKQKIEDQAVAAGLSRTAVHLLLGQIDELKPKDITVSVQTAAARANMYDLLSLYSQLNVMASAVGSSQRQNRTALGRASGGPVPQYRAAGGAVQAAYLATGGSPFQPRGTDTVAAMLTPEEFVVKRSSARYDPGFMQAYNDNPKKALNDVAGGKQSMVGLSIVGTLDLGNGLKGTIRGVVQEELSENGVEAKMRAAS